MARGKTGFIVRFHLRAEFILRVLLPYLTFIAFMLPYIFNGARCVLSAIRKLFDTVFVTL